MNSYEIFYFLSIDKWRKLVDNKPQWGIDYEVAVGFYKEKGGTEEDCMTKIDVFSGFLGAGKTTLIKKLLKEALQDTKVVLIENEFGEIGIDGGFWRMRELKLRKWIPAVFVALW